MYVLNLTIPQLRKSVQRLRRYGAIKNVTYVQDTREKHYPSFAVGYLYHIFETTKYKRENTEYNVV